ncbi:TetR family transcriptional regulator C-terminal domain-containing protein [Bacillus wiedmannii]|uniref:TetR-like C-terminal domain-containing protein n=1 Tax=Bacillus wiedmannii TaxID=1890302 RepID=UPI0021CE221A|nr:TetR-like C-terminal domain-containing protein [Bacillus wiedmannii]MCU5707873.1 TetR family transcriptional regulator C-terminal domain-containing protein [Bacillus wiedmannii]
MAVPQHRDFIEKQHLEKLNEEHIKELRKLCESGADLDFVEGNLVWFEYFERNCSFFSTMLASKGAPTFRSHFLKFVIEELEGEVDVSKGKNQGLNKDLILKCFGAAIVEIVTAWITNGLSESSKTVVE